MPENAKYDPLVCSASDLNAFALGVLKYDSASTNQTMTRTFESMALWMSGPMVLSMLGSSICGVMNRMARFAGRTLELEVGAEGPPASVAGGAPLVEGRLSAGDY